MPAPLSRIDIHEALRSIRSERQEHFLCLSVGIEHQIIACHTVFIGTLTGVLAHPREIFAVAIADHAAAIIVAGDEHYSFRDGGLIF
jgi:DNA repair protein RadC